MVSLHHLLTSVLHTLLLVLMKILILRLFSYGRQKVIKDFATAKPCVIVGSCADYILRDREDCLKVFLYADEETKENRIQEIYGEAGLKLKNRVKDMDVRRGLNYKYFTGQDWGKAQNYDLALNRGSLGIEKCAQLIVDAASEE